MSRNALIAATAVMVAVIAGVVVYLATPDTGDDPGGQNGKQPHPAGHFRDGTREASITFRMSFLPKEQGENFKINLYDHGCGVAIADYDGDGHEDIYFLNQLGPNALYRNKGDGRFEEVTARAGVALGDRVCVGATFADYDNDGDQDLFVTSTRGGNVLFRNKGDGSFEDVSTAAGLAQTFYGMGVTAGDYDNDGHVDLFFTALGGCRLFRNEAGAGGKRRFVDATEQAGAFAPAGSWATTGDFLKRDEPMDFPSSAAFLDFDKDGLLDLFVCNYVRWSPKYDLSQGFTLAGKGRAYGPPKAFKGTYCQLFRNLGGGKFKDVSAQTGIQVTGPLDEPVGKSLGVLVADVDDDGWPDVLVANDTVRNFFFHNQGNGTFRERGEEAGAAYADGNPRGGMGIDWAEYRPGKYAVAIGNFANEPNTLFCLLNRKNLVFSDMALVEGMAGPSRIMLVFGLFFFDYDLDGRPDLLSCNGHLEPDIHLVQPSQSFKQPAQLFWNTGDKWAFEPLTEKECGPDLFAPQVGRGCAFADMDGDGDLDVVLTANGGPVRLLANEGGTGHHWVRLVLKGDGKTVNRSAIGAEVALTAGGKTQHQHVVSGRGYLSQSELGLTFGLGTADKIEKVEIRWPGKDVPPQVLTDLAVDRVHVIEMGASGPAAK